MATASPAEDGSFGSSLSTTILVASGAPLVPLAGRFSGPVQAVQDQRDSARLAKHSQRVLATAGALGRLLVDLQRGSRGFVITGLAITPARGRVDVRVASDGEHVVPEVADSGIGITPAEAHGGSIGVESGEGRGSVFRARLPRDAAAAGAAVEFAYTAEEG